MGYTDFPHPCAPCLSGKPRVGQVGARSVVSKALLLWSFPDSTDLADLREGESKRLPPTAERLGQPQPPTEFLVG